MSIKSWIFILIIILIVHSMRFYSINYKRYGPPKMKGIGVAKAIAVDYALIKTWKTRYCWAGILQVIIMIAVIILSFFDRQ